MVRKRLTDATSLLDKQESGFGGLDGIGGAGDDALSHLQGFGENVFFGYYFVHAGGRGSKVSCVERDSVWRLTSGSESTRLERL